MGFIPQKDRKAHFAQRAREKAARDNVRPQPPHGWQQQNFPQSGPSMAPPPLHMPYIAQDQFALFRQFESDIHARSFDNFRTLMSSQATTASNVQPGGYTPVHTQFQPHGMNPQYQPHYTAPYYQPQHMYPYHQPSQFANSQFMGSQQPGPAMFSQSGQSSMPQTSCYTENGGPTPGHSLASPRITPVSDSDVGVPIKRKSVSPILEATDSKRSKYSAVTGGEPKHCIDLTTTSKVKTSKEPTFPANPMGTVLALEASSIEIISEKPSAPKIPISRKDTNMISLASSVQLAESKLDGPKWKEGVQLDDFTVITKEHFRDMKPPGWYSAQTIYAWRAAVTIPPNWIVLIHDEVLTRHPIPAETTNILKVLLEEDRKHWTLLHLSINDWKMTYYDSFLARGTKESNDIRMVCACTELMDTLRSKRTKNEITLPSQDPQMSIKCTIRQTDSDSCGPFVLREAEILLGFNVEDDQECPIAIRCRHIKSIFIAMVQRMDEAEKTPSSTTIAQSLIADSCEVVSDKMAKSFSNASTTSPTPLPSHEISNPVTATPETSLPSDFAEEPIETIESPELQPSLSFSEALNQDSMLEDNPYITNSLLHDSFDDGFGLSMSGRETPPPAPDSMGDCSEDIQIANLDSATEHNTKRKGSSDLLKELTSSLKVAEETLQFRPRMRYTNYYLPLPGVEDEHLSTIDEDEFELQ